MTDKTAAALDANNKAKIEAALRFKPENIVAARDGVEAYGLYVELIRFTEYHGALNTHIRLFLFENSLAMYTRPSSKKAGRWTTSYFANHGEARAKLVQVIERLEHIGFVVELRGEPLLIQASVSDIVAVRKNDKRGADCRWRGINTMEARLGKVTNETKPLTFTPTGGK